MISHTERFSALFFFLPPRGFATSLRGITRAIRRSITRITTQSVRDAANSVSLYFCGVLFQDHLFFSERNPELTAFVDVVCDSTFFLFHFYAISNYNFLRAMFVN